MSKAIRPYIDKKNQVKLDAIGKVVDRKTTYLVNMILDNFFESGDGLEKAKIILNNNYDKLNFNNKINLPKGKQ